LASDIKLVSPQKEKAIIQLSDFESKLEVGLLFCIDGYDVEKMYSKIQDKIHMDYSNVLSLDDEMTKNLTMNTAVIPYEQSSKAFKFKIMT